MIGLVYGDDPAFFAGQHELFEYLKRVEIQFALDGQARETTRTAIKRFADPSRFGLDEAFVFHAGAFLPPATLAIGSHSLETSISDPIYGDDSWTVQFTVLDC